MSVLTSLTTLAGAAAVALSAVAPASAAPSAPTDLAAAAARATAGTSVHRAVTHGSVIPRPATQVPYALPLLHVPSSAAHRSVADAYDTLCTSTAISAYELVTAAHCVTRPGLYYVMVGGNSMLGGKAVPVAAVRYNPQYDARDITHDVAVVRTLLPMRLPAYAKLGTASQARAVTSAKAPALHTYGWGRASDTAAPDGRLRGVTVKSLRSLAQRVYGSGFDARTEIAAGKPLSGGRFAGTCQGDSGGPLVTRSGSTTTLVGVTSFGADAGCDVAPGVYTSVATYRSWIVSALHSLPSLAATRSRALPVALGHPKVTGSVRLGAALTCVRPRFTANTRTVSVAWYRSGRRVTSGTKHVLVRSDAGRSLVCRVTARSSAGTRTVSSSAVTVPHTLKAA